MKRLILIASLIVSTSVFARSLHPDTFAKKATLKTWQFDDNSYLSNLDIIAGDIKVNEVMKKVELMLVDDNCPANALCVRGPLIRIELPLISVEKDSCGVVTYHALSDKMPVDGTRQELIVRDNQLSICEIVYSAHTTIQYNVKFWNRMTRDLIEQESYLTADRLQ
jgi:hypothetical protein